MNCEVARESRARGIVCGLVFLTACSAEPLTAQADTPDVDPLDYASAAPGRGYNLLTDKVHDFCLGSSEMRANHGLDGKSIYFSLDLIEDTKTLARKMSVSASASISYGLFGGEGKAKFVAESEMSQNSVFALATIRVRNAPLILFNPKLAADAAETLVANPERFRERCGDGFIGSITSGAEYYGLIEIATSSEVEKRDVKAAVSASGGIWSAKVEFEKAVNSAVKNKTVHVRTIQGGGDAAQGRPCKDVECILRRVDEMLGVSSTHPQLIDIAVISYRALALPRDADLPIDVQAKQEVESMIVERKMDMLDYRARYRDALMHPFYVENYDAKRVQEQLSACETNITKLHAAASACYRSHQACEMPGLSILGQPPARLNFAPPWPAGSPRFASPRYDAVSTDSVMPCPNGDVLTTNSDARARIEWAIGCNLLSNEVRDEMMTRLRGGRVIPRDKLLYPTFSYDRGGTPAWVPSMKHYTSAAGLVTDCYVPPDVLWLGNCSVFSAP
jgi:hypothetical protein